MNRCLTCDEAKGYRLVEGGKCSLSGTKITVLPSKQVLREENLRLTPPTIKL